MLTAKGPLPVSGASGFPAVSPQPAAKHNGNKAAAPICNCFILSVAPTAFLVNPTYYTLHFQA